MSNISDNKLDIVIDYLKIILHKLNELSESQSFVDKEYLSTNEAAQFLNFSAQNVYKLAREKAIPSYKRSHRLFFKKDDLIEWMQRGERTLNQQ